MQLAAPPGLREPEAVEGRHREDRPAGPGAGHRALPGGARLRAHPRQGQRGQRRRRLRRRHRRHAGRRGHLAGRLQAQAAVPHRQHRAALQHDRLPGRAPVQQQRQRPERDGHRQRDPSRYVFPPDFKQLLLFVINVTVLVGNAGVWVQTHTIYYRPLREDANAKQASVTSSSHSSRKGKGSSNKSASRRKGGELWNGNLIAFYFETGSV